MFEKHTARLPQECAAEARAKRQQKKVDQHRLLQVQCEARKNSPPPEKIKVVDNMQLFEESVVAADPQRMRRYREELLDQVKAKKLRDRLAADQMTPFEQGYNMMEFCSYSQS